MATLNQVIEGLQVFAKYDEHNVCAEHDIIYARAYTDLTPEDTATLERLGWHWSKQADSWGVFV